MRPALKLVPPLAAPAAVPAPLPPQRHLSIWWSAFGYFAAYVPYAALTRALSDGKLAGSGAGVSGTVMLPATAVASTVLALAFVFFSGWWRYAGTVRIAGKTLPAPSWWTLASGVCASVTIATTTLAYTFENTSVLLMVLLMRGGVLAIAPVVDVLSGRKIRLVSAFALTLSLLSLVVALKPGQNHLSWPAIIDLSLYLLSYLVRLRTMSARAKTTDKATTLRYFVEEQLVASPALLAILGAAALVGYGPFREGFHAFVSAPWVLWAIGIGLLSQLTGIFGGLVLLGSEENSYTVPVNRASSILAGVIAGVTLWLAFGFKAVPTRELVGAAVLLIAIAVLAYPAIRAARARPGTATPR